MPIALLGTWFGLSYYDINFGYLMLSRPMHDFVFELYGNILGVDPKEVPWLVLKAIIMDTFLLMGIVAFKRRAQIRAWWQARQKASGPADALSIDDNLSSAP